MSTMKVNIPEKQPFCLYVRCIDDSPSITRKPVLDRIHKGEVYAVYAMANALNSTSGNVAYYIKDQSGRKVEAHDGVPTWRAERFEPALPLTEDPYICMFMQYLN